MRRLLLLAYYFPPMGGSGVQRALKFCRYLPELGWLPAVVTVKDVTYHVRDPQLLSEVPDEVNVIRTESLDPLRLHRRLSSGREGPVGAMNPPGGTERHSGAGLGLYRKLKPWLFLPDPQVLWNPWCVSAAVRQGRSEGAEVVLAMSPACSTALAGRAVARRLGIPLVLDFRDAWTQDPYFRMPTPVHRGLNRWLERMCLASARHVTVISPRMAENLVSLVPSLRGRTSVVPNGYDPRDLPARIEEDRSEEARDEGFRMAYVGSLHSHHGEALRTLASAWAQLSRSCKEFAAKAKLEVVGHVAAEARRVVMEHLDENQAVWAGYRPHQEALRRMAKAQGLLLLIHSGRGNETTLTGKVFEYLAVGRPILLIGPSGDAGDLLGETRGGVRFEPGDAASVAGYLRESFEAWRTGRCLPGADPSRVARYDRRALAGELARVLESVTAEGGPE